MVAGRNLKLLAQQIKEFRPRCVVHPARKRRRIIAQIAWPRQG